VFSDPAADYDGSTLAPVPVDPEWAGDFARIREWPLPMVTSATQAMRVQQIEARRAALTAQLDAAFPPAALVAVAGNVVAFDTGLDGDVRSQTYRVESGDPAGWMQDGAAMAFAVPMVLRADAASVYAWVPATDEQDFYVEADPLPDATMPLVRFVTPSVSGSVLSVLIGHAGAYQVGGPDDGTWIPTPRGVFVDWQFRRNQEPFWQSAPSYESFGFDDLTRTLQPVTAGESYDIRVRHRDSAGALSDWVYVRAVPVGFVLGAPTGLSATAGAGQVALSVTAPVDAAFAPIQFWVVYTERFRRRPEGQPFVDWLRKRFEQDDAMWFREEFVHPRDIFSNVRKFPGPPVSRPQS
jgi:hypothetical protein